MEEHLEDDHAASLFFVAGGHVVVRGRYVYGPSSWAVLAPHASEQVRQGVPSKRDAIDRHVRFVLDGDGPRLVSVSATVASEKLRRAGNILHTLSVRRTSSEGAAAQSRLSSGLTGGTSGTLSFGRQPPGWPHARAPEDHVVCRRGCSLRTSLGLPPCQSSRSNTGSTGC